MKDMTTLIPGSADITEFDIQRIVKINTVNVLIDAPLPTEQVEKIRSLSPRIELIDGMKNGGLAKAHVIYSGECAFDPSDAPNLEWVQTESAGIDGIQDQPISHTGIPVCSGRGAFSVPVAEYAIALLLSLTRRLPVVHRLQENGRWPCEEDQLNLYGDNCYGKTLGILGYGNIGRHVARVADAMGMRVLACDKWSDVKKERPTFHLPNTGDPDGTIPKEWYDVSHLKEMLAKCSVLILTLPITESTRNLVGKSELEALPVGSYIVNVGRGAVINEEALVETIRSGRFAGVALDVYTEEPLSDESPLWSLPNVIVSPHIASGNMHRARFTGEVLAYNLERYLAGEPLVNVVNFAKGF